MYFAWLVDLALVAGMVMEVMVVVRVLEKIAALRNGEKGIDNTDNPSHWEYSRC